MGGRVGGTTTQKHAFAQYLFYFVMPARCARSASVIPMHLYMFSARKPERFAMPASVIQVHQLPGSEWMPARWRGRRQ